MKKIIIIISGSVAAKKSYELIKLFKLTNTKITCVVTEAGIKFIDKKKLSKIINNKIYCKNTSNYDHINLSRNHDAILICPASANIIAKYSQGIANDFASTLLLASNKPLFIAPAMNKEMWNNQSTQNNVNNLYSRGVYFIGPVKGNLACGEIGNGRLEKINTIVDTINIFLNSKKILKNKKVVITSGPTREYLDPIRFITNNSSGKQGYAIAKVLSSFGCNVNLVSGPTNIPAPHGISLHSVTTADQMYKAVKKLLPCDVAIFVSAVTDFKSKNISHHKISNKKFSKVNFVKNIDILNKISSYKNKKATLTIGFSAETKNLERNAKRKLLEKKCDWILANQITKKNPSFGSDYNKMTFISHNKTEHWKKMSKINIANKIAEKIIEFFY